MRLDRWLAVQNFAPSRSKAEDWIQKGLVEIYLNDRWDRVFKTSFDVSTDFPPAHVRIIENDLTVYASRAGAKLAAFLDEAKDNFQFENAICLDVGQSTGGFTDVLLKRGAARVVGVEVGHSQLHPRLRNDDRVTTFERLHIVEAREHTEFMATVPKDGGFDWIVVDVSFISLTKVLPHLKGFGKQIIFLIKPQFETEKKVVAIDEAITKVKECFFSCGGFVTFERASSLGGRDGNQEYFASGHFCKDDRLVRDHVG